jgi:hypothetical protein
MFAGFERVLVVMQRLCKGSDYLRITSVFAVGKMSANVRLYFGAWFTKSSLKVHPETSRKLYES